MRASVLRNLLVLGLLASPLSAQSLNEADLAALRYFASINDQPAFDAELRRLRGQYPEVDFAPFVERFQSGIAEVDTTPIWDLIRAEQDEEARALIAQTRQENPGWTPSEDMLSILAIRDDQRAIDQAFAADDLEEVMRIAASEPGLLDCDRVNNAWRLAELMQAEGQEDEAEAIMQEILATCEDEEIIVATLQKSSAFLSRAEIQEWVADTAEARPDMAERLAALDRELAPPIARAAAPVAPQSSGPNAQQRAENAVYAATRANQWGRCLRLTQGMTSNNMRLQRGWCALNAGQPREAARNFETVARRDSGTNRRDAAYGWSLALVQLNQLESAERVYQTFSLSAQQNRELRRIMLPKLASRSMDRNRHRQALRYISRYESEFGSGPRWLQMVKGWALWNSGRQTQARRVFRAVHSASPGQDTAEALRITR